MPSAFSRIRTILIVFLDRGFFGKKFETLAHKAGVFVFARCRSRSCGDLAVLAAVVLLDKVLGWESNGVHENICFDSFYFGCFFLFVCASF
jgi:hypothetical protein